jgi:hypothetical protein
LQLSPQAWCKICLGFRRRSFSFFVSKTAFAGLLFFCAFGYGNQRSVAAFAADPLALFRFETLGQASRQSQPRDQTLLRLAAGLKRCVSRIHLLRGNLRNLRLERFKTSHARVKRNLLLWSLAARKKEAFFVIFLCRTCSSCGSKWKRGEGKRLLHNYCCKSGRSPKANPAEFQPHPICVAANCRLQ